MPSCVCDAKWDVKDRSVQEFWQEQGGEVRVYADAGGRSGSFGWSKGVK
jgi:hypothetical protein